MTMLAGINDWGDLVQFLLPDVLFLAWASSRS